MKAKNQQPHILCLKCLISIVLGLKIPCLHPDNIIPLEKIPGHETSKIQNLKVGRLRGQFLSYFLLQGRGQKAPLAVCESKGCTLDLTWLIKSELIEPEYLLNNL